MKGEFTVVRVDPSDPECLQLIDQLSAELGALYGDDGGANSFDPRVPLSAGAAFFVARVDGQAVGCGGIRPLERGVGEVKRMYVVPAARGQGISRRLLQQIELTALDMGYERVRLETGTKQTAAIGLYESAGYHRGPLFGQYIDDPRSICFEKDLRRRNLDQK